MTLRASKAVAIAAADQPATAGGEGRAEKDPCFSPKTGSKQALGVFVREIKSDAAPAAALPTTAGGEGRAGKDPCFSPKTGLAQTAGGGRCARIASRHPCFAQGKPNARGRIHLPVSPGCNINCRFCQRSLNWHEQRPGVSVARLKPTEAAQIVDEALALAPELGVVGVAGPGEALATSFALETFALIKRRFPQLLRCLSTNGLLLEERLSELLEVGVDTLTVTVNDIEPERLTQIVDRVTYQGKRYSGTSATRLLIANQLQGIRAAAEAGLLIKVNTVLVPGVNDAHIGTIARHVKAAGAGLYNIIPLIPNADLADLPAPTCAQIAAARQAAEQHIAVFRHCQHCRADAIGIPGGPDLSAQIYRRHSGQRISQANTFSHG